MRSNSNPWRCCMKDLLWVGRFGPPFTTGMKSKVHPTYKTKYRVANWPAYNQALVRRGDVTGRCCMKTLPAWGGALLVTLRRSHTTRMKSKVDPTYKTKYRVANWPAYNQALVRRGDVTVWVSSDAIAA